MIDTGPLPDAVQRMESLIGQGAWEDAAACFTPGVTYRVGARPPVTGLDGIRRYMEWQTERVSWDGHDLNRILVRDSTVLFEVVSHFTRRADGSTFKLPCVDIYTFEGDRIADWRVYADMTAFAPDPQT
ncbi:MAG: nuclear transport factor 2 family protein [Pseudomonadota bacterium]